MAFKIEDFFDSNFYKTDIANTKLFFETQIANREYNLSKRLSSDPYLIMFKNHKVIQGSEGSLNQKIFIETQVAKDYPISNKGIGVGKAFGIEALLIGIFFIVALGKLSKRKYY